MNTTIFSAIDDQEHSGWAADAAIDIAHATSSSLIFFMANPAVLPGRGPVVYQWSKEYIDEYFEKGRNRARLAGVYDLKCITKNSVDIANSILFESQNVDAKYIVIGSNHRRGLIGNIRYSISREVVSRAHCPTLVVHKNILHRGIGSFRTLAAE